MAYLELAESAKSGPCRCILVTVRHCCKATGLAKYTLLNLAGMKF
jgi:hypothetical protein